MNQLSDLREALLDALARHRLIWHRHDPETAQTDLEDLYAQPHPDVVAWRRFLRHHGPQAAIGSDESGLDGVCGVAADLAWISMATAQGWWGRVDDPDDPGRLAMSRAAATRWLLTVQYGAGLESIATRHAVEEILYMTLFAWDMADASAGLSSRRVAHGLRRLGWVTRREARRLARRQLGGAS